MSTATETPISFEWFEPHSAVIHRGGQSWAKLTYGDYDLSGEGRWWVSPMLELKGERVTTAPRPLSCNDRSDQETAGLLALVEIGKPDFRPPPRFATDAAVWAHVKAKNPKPYDEWSPRDFAAANKIYGFSLRKYGENNPELAAKYGVTL